MGWSARRSVSPSLGCCGFLPSHRRLAGLGGALGGLVDQTRLLQQALNFALAALESHGSAPLLLPDGSYRLQVDGVLGPLTQDAAFFVAEALGGMLLTSGPIGAFVAAPSTGTLQAATPDLVGAIETQLGFVPSAAPSPAPAPVTLPAPVPTSARRNLGLGLMIAGGVVLVGALAYGLGAS